MQRTIRRVVNHIFYSRPLHNNYSIMSYSRTLYPSIEPYQTGQLSVSSLHTMYWEQSGNPQGVPALVVHGGPGGGSDGWTRSFFDPNHYRIIMYDQRGCGKSTPNAELRDNTTWALVEDIEKLRKELNVDKWLVFGGSWGSTLSLAYSETHPTRVIGLVLRGIFLLRHSELAWFYEQANGASMIMPDQWEKFLEPIPEVERHHLMAAYYRRLTGDDEEIKRKCAIAWSVWELSTSRLFVDPAHISKAADDAEFAVQFSRIESHYFVNGGFFSHDGQLLTDAHKIAHIPTVIVQGRYDLVCPMRSAFDLHKVLPNAEFKVVPDAGHSAKETGIIHELVAATDKFKSLKA